MQKVKWQSKPPGRPTSPADRAATGEVGELSSNEAAVQERPDPLV